MNKKIRGFIVLILALAIFTGVFAGCVAPRTPGPARKPGPTTPSPKRTGVNIPEQSRMAAREAKKVSGVTNAIAVTTGSTAFVGINLKGSPATEKVDGIKRDVANKIKGSDKRITSVLVTADPNIYKEISNIYNGIEKGKPISAFQSQINDLTKRITPTIR